MYVILLTILIILIKTRVAADDRIKNISPLFEKKTPNKNQ